VFSYEQDYYLQRASIVLNIGSSDVSVLETHRINNLLSMGKVVVSEVKANATIAEDYKDVVVLVPIIAKEEMNDEDISNIEIRLIEEQASIIHQILLNLLADENELKLRSQLGRSHYVNRLLPNHKLKLYQALNQTVNYFSSSIHIKVLTRRNQVG
jgi:hypothetical protein